MIKFSCFPLDLEYDDGEKKLYFNGVERTPSVRTLGEMKTVVVDEAFFILSDKKRVQYYLFPGIVRKEDAGLFKDPSLQPDLEYGVTILPPLELGREFNKTLGHYPPKGPCGSRYAEICEVLEGDAHYLLQKVDEGTGLVDGVLLVKAKKGDKAVIPAGYGHVLINPSAKTLVSARLAGVFGSECDPYRLKAGAAYFEFIDDSLVPNGNYESLPMAKTVEAMALPVNQQFDGDNIYAQFIEDPRKFDFLRK